MDYCPGCGAALHGEPKFCSACGTPVAEQTFEADTSSALSALDQSPPAATRHQTLPMIVGSVIVAFGLCASVLFALRATSVAREHAARQPNRSAGTAADSNPRFTPTVPSSDGAEVDDGRMPRNATWNTVLRWSAREGSTSPVFSLNGGPSQLLLNHAKATDDWETPLWILALQVKDPQEGWRDVQSEVMHWGLTLTSANREQADVLGLVDIDGSPLESGDYRFVTGVCGQWTIRVQQLGPLATSGVSDTGRTSGLYVPAKGTALRGALMQAARTVRGGEDQYIVDELYVSGSWAVGRLHRVGSRSLPYQDVYAWHRVSGKWQCVVAGGDVGDDPEPTVTVRTALRDTYEIPPHLVNALSFPETDGAQVGRQ